MRTADLNHKNIPKTLVHRKYIKLYIFERLCTIILKEYITNKNLCENIL